MFCVPKEDKNLLNGDKKNGCELGTPVKVALGVVTTLAVLGLLIASPVITEAVVGYNNDTAGLINTLADISAGTIIASVAVLFGLCALPVCLVKAGVTFSGDTVDSNPPRRAVER